MIRHFHIENFKSLVDFTLPPSPHALPHFACVIGLNGAGKSTLLQAFDFIACLVAGDVDAWLSRRGWEKHDLTSRFSRKRLIDFRLGFHFSEFGDVVWSGSFNATQLRCTAESVVAGGRELLAIGESGLRVAQATGDDIAYPLQGLSFQGSTLSFLKPEALQPALRALMLFVRGMKSLDMLSPQAMRRRAKEGDAVGYGGERLSAFLHGMSKARKEALQAALTSFYPNVSAWETRALRAGWKDLQVREEYRDAFGNPLDTTARHLNDGMLRILTILAQTLPEENGWGGGGWGQGPYGGRAAPAFLLFDEIENGINPELMDRLIRHLLAARTQIIATTHSPMVLNYLPDDVARTGVILLYRTPQGHTRAVRFFDLPSAQRKLTLLGPGEVFVDCNLETLSVEAEQLGQAA